MSINWSATGDMLSGIGAIAGAIAVLAVGYFGRSAIENFRGQRQTERQMEHAENILASAYELVDALDSIRNPASSAYERKVSEEELEGNEKLTGLTEEKKHLWIQANVFYVRSRYFNEQFERAQKLTPYAAAFFGKEVREALEDLIRCRHIVKVYANAYAEDRGHDEDFDRKITAAIWKGSALDDPDEVTEKTETAIEYLEEKLFPIIRLPDSQQRKKTRKIEGK